MSFKKIKTCYQDAKVIIEKDGSAVLDLPDIPEPSKMSGPNGTTGPVLIGGEGYEAKSFLPKVSVVTVIPMIEELKRNVNCLGTPNLINYIAPLLHCWYSLSGIYSTVSTGTGSSDSNIQWILLDLNSYDSLCESLDSYFPEENNVKYYKINNAPKDLPEWEKRNMVNQLAKGDYICHLDFGTYYFPDSLLAKIRVLLKDSDRECIFSWTTGIYDVVNRDSYIVNINEQSANIDLSSAVYSKKYWENHKFTENPNNFVHKRFRKFMNIHFLFNCIKLVENFNEDDESQTINGVYFKREEYSISNGRYEDVLTDSVLDTLENMRSFIVSESK